MSSQKCQDTPRSTKGHILGAQQFSPALSSPQQNLPGHGMCKHCQTLSMAPLLGVLPFSLPHYVGSSQMEKECSLDPVGRTELMPTRATASGMLDKGLKTRKQTPAGLRQVLVCFRKDWESRGNSPGELASTLGSGPDLRGWACILSRGGVLGGRERASLLGGVGVAVKLQGSSLGTRLRDRWKFKYSWPLNSGVWTARVHLHTDVFQ